MKNAKLFLSALLAITTLSAVAQDYPYDVTQYPFVRYDLNKIHFSKDSSGFNTIYQKLDSMILLGKGKLTVSKDGGQIDAITAASITSRAFLKAVNNAYEVYKNRDTDAQSGATQKN